ncbi:MAG: SWIM zinc finger family protein [Peptostreptococcaceae bacterium]|nr:SWIM zinc finger family protein [Peptostreptococcaceae bacterium]
MEKKKKIAYGLIGFSIAGVLIGAFEGKFSSGLIGSLPFCLVCIYLLTSKNKVEPKIYSSDSEPNCESGSEIREWGYWDSFIHKEERQLRKQERALYIKPLKIHKDASNGEFVSLDTGEVYNTSLKSCTCESFRRDQIPCKHMYSLAYNIGFFKPIHSPSATVLKKLEVMEEFSKLDRESKYLIAYNRISSNDWSFFDKGTANTLLTTNLVNTTKDLRITLPKLTKYDLSKFLDKYGVSYKKSISKQEVIDILLDNENILNDSELYNLLPIPIKLNKSVEPFLGSLRGKYANEYSEC